MLQCANLGYRLKFLNALVYFCNHLHVNFEKHYIMHVMNFT